MTEDYILDRLEKAVTVFDQIIYLLIMGYKMNLDRMTEENNFLRKKLMALEKATDTLHLHNQNLLSYPEALKLIKENHE